MKSYEMKPLSSHQEMYESLLILKSNHFSSNSWDALGFHGCQNGFHITSFEIDHGLSIDNLNFLSTLIFLGLYQGEHITPLNRGFTYLNLGGRCMSNGCNCLGFFYGWFQRLPYCYRHHEKMLSQKMFLNMLNGLKMVTCSPTPRCILFQTF